MNSIDNKKRRKIGKVILIGCGPGDPELITIRAQRFIHQSAVAIYDHLVDKRILDMLPETAEKIYVGKKKGYYTYSQNQINKILVERARQNKGQIIVRLKGGDPFVFGRGGEEAEFLAEKRVPFELVPGITAGIAAAAYSGIPVTHRQANRVLTFLTCYDDTSTQDTDPIEWDHLPKGTLLFYMGVTNIGFISKQLINHGWDPETPVAVIQWACLPWQRTVTGLLKNISQTVKEQRIRPPGIIVVGSVVNFRSKLNWYETKPLFGVRIIVTSSREQAKGLMLGLEQEGAEVILLPLIKAVNPSSFTDLDQAIKNISQYRYIVFSSQNAVLFFFERFYFLKKDIRDLAGIKLMAVGPRTAQKLNERGLKDFFVPGEYGKEGVLRFFLKMTKHQGRVLLPRAEMARDTFYYDLKAAGWKVTMVPVYKTLKISFDGKNILERLKMTPRLTYVTFSSGSAVEAFRQGFSHKIFKDIKKMVKFVSIGSDTSAIARKLKIDIEAEAREHSGDGILKTILAISKNPS